MSYVIYTKENCKYCRMAKEELTARNLYFQEMKLNEDFRKLDYISKEVPSIQTVPQIFYNNKYIGGYTELMKSFENEK